LCLLINVLGHKPTAQKRAVAGGAGVAVAVSSIGQFRDLQKDPPQAQKLFKGEAVGYRGLSSCWEKDSPHPGQANFNRFFLINSRVVIG